MGKFCKDCQFWLFAYESMLGKFGTCDHPTVEGKVVLDEENDSEYVIHTEQFFGCIYHETIQNNVITKLPPYDDQSG